MKKILHISNIGGKNFKVNFMQGTLKAVHKLGYDLYSVCNRTMSSEEQMKKEGEEYGLKLLHADIERSPFSRKNLKAYKQLIKIVQENGLEYIHCNTPVGGILGRLIGKKCKVKKVIYQAHGFHFYKGAPVKNWILYYPTERLLAHWTDAIITINKEDFEMAKNFRLRKKGKVYYVHGVGIDTAEFRRNDSIRQEKRRELNMADDDIIILSVGELNANKNNKVIIEAMSKLKNKKIHYFLCGTGDLKEQMMMQAESCGISENVHFLGFRSDVKELYSAADIFVMPSLREGLSRSLMEAMSAGLPCVVSKIRGNVDLIEEGKGGFLFNPEDTQTIFEKIKMLAGNEELRINMGKHNEKAVLPYDIENVKEEIREMYLKEIN